VTIPHIAVPRPISWRCHHSVSGRSITKYVDDDWREASFLAWQLGMTITK